MSRADRPEEQKRSSLRSPSSRAGSSEAYKWAVARARADRIHFQLEGFPEELRHEISQLRLVADILEEYWVSDEEERRSGQA